MNTDILIVGSGCSGLYCALKLPRTKKITIITKSKLEDSDSFLAQGGICVLQNQEDYDSFYEDTMRAGHYENREESVDIMIRSSMGVIEELIDYGVDFCRNPDGSLDFTKEGGHSKKRILYHKDITGQEITSKLLAQVKMLDNVTLLENTTMIDIIEENEQCKGAVIKRADGRLEVVEAECTVLATGGIGGLYKYSTNYPHLTGDSIAIALRHNIELENIDYVQIHPTTFYIKDNKERSFLISESVRGEGAKLYNKNGERFVDELLPRDLLTAAIKKQMSEDDTEFVWEDLRPIPADELKEHFPNIVEYCMEKGYDVTKQCIPVVPAQHYFMGGIKVNSVSKTSMKCLYAIGETACNGVHGKNRLASNSLLESLVFAKRAALDMIENPDDCNALSKVVDVEKYQDINKWNQENKKLVLEEIDRRKANVR